MKAARSQPVTVSRLAKEYIHGPTVYASGNRCRAAVVKAQVIDILSYQVVPVMEF